MLNEAINDDQNEEKNIITCRFIANIYFPKLFSLYYNKALQKPPA